MSKGTIETLTKRIDALEQQIALLSNTETLKTKPKKKPSGYNLFCKDMRDTAKKQLENESNGLFKPTDIMKRLGSMWKTLSEQQKIEWNHKTIPS